jgi:hypothetical protein
MCAFSLAICALADKKNPAAWQDSLALQSGQII